MFNQSGTIEQSNHYYPFGITFGERTDNTYNRYKYNTGKYEDESGNEVSWENVKSEYGIGQTQETSDDKSEDVSSNAATSKKKFKLEGYPQEQGLINVYPEFDLFLFGRLAANSIRALFAGSSIETTGEVADNVTNNILKTDTRTLQHMFSRHAKDFGITSNWGKTIAREFQEVLESHMKGVNPIKGTYRGTQQVLHYFDLKTGLNAMTDMNGNLVGGWRLSLDQIKYLLSTHSIK